MIWSCSTFHLMQIILLWSSINLLLTTSFTNETDRLALLAFKNQVSNDPLGSLSSWNHSLHHCLWNGVKCGRRHPDRVTILDLDSQKLEGTLSPYLGNLTFLRSIFLSSNKFHGEIPQEMGHLFRLQVLLLANNSFNGNIPTNLTHCLDLRRIHLMNNNLSGGIPVEFGSLPRLNTLALGKNELSGSIPSSLANLSFLNNLVLPLSSLVGGIPNELCRIQGLRILSVYSNYLNGVLPSCFYNLSQLTIFEVSDNQLEGNLPPEMGLTLPNLEGFYVAVNKFKGHIPSSLSNASKLSILELSQNQFTGQVPRDLGRLQALYRLNIGSNQLGSMSGYDLDFITSLANCTNLISFSIFNNSFKGHIPDSIGNLSTQMTHLSLSMNRLHGSIPAGMEYLFGLAWFELSYNYLSGEIPKWIGNFPQLQIIQFDENRFSGQIPESFGNLSLLEELILSGNELDGSIPRSLGGCKNLIALFLDNNNLNGTIPKQIIGLSSLKYVLNLSNNALSGPLPLEVGNLSDLMGLDISRNKLFGYVPNTLGNCLTLVALYMGNNFFKGSIPQSLSSLKGLAELDLSHNKLVGRIPQFFGNFTLLTYMNLSYNELEGSLPEGGVFSNASAISVVGNSKLCGGVAELKLPPCQVNKKGKPPFRNIVLPVISGLVCLVLLMCFIFTCYRRRISKEKPSSPSLLGHQFTRISYAELLKATNSFCVDNLIGVGSYGSVYKGVLSQGDTVIAVKVFDLQQRGASRSFLLECNAMRNLRHRNLLKIITCCSSVDFQGNDFKALIFEFMPNRSLEEWLHHNPESSEQYRIRNLSFLERLDIAIDVASALDYLHNHCQPAIVHCDLKPSNVLLDADMTAHVADFGLAKIFPDHSYNSSQSQGSSLAIKGSIGYVAPVIAVKVFDLQQRGASRSFVLECNAMRNLRHRNLLKIITCCSSVDFQGNDFKALIFEFMPNRSLEEWLHHNPESSEQYRIRNLSFLERLDIAIDVASALDYLHNHCQPAIVHYDLKPSNVLLDADMTAHVADFGLAKIFPDHSYNSSQSQGSSLAIKGSIGYVAPEYGVGGEISKEGDVYSYGILLLEMITGKRPTDEMFRDGQNLHSFAKTALSLQVMNIVDPSMISEDTDEAIELSNQSDRRVRMQVCLVSAIKLGVTCSAESPIERMNMGEIITALYHIRDHHQGA